MNASPSLSDSQVHVQDRNKSLRFRDDATAVLSALRIATRGALSELDGVGKPADLQRALKIDQTLSWQIFRIAGQTDLLGSGSAVPSRTAIQRFLKAMRAKGLAAKKANEIMNGYAAFEQLIERHVGDRVTFNSMVSAASDVDDEWISTDLQHRRNMFRGMSHAMGLRIKTRLQTIIITDVPNTTSSDVIMLNGSIDLQILRDFENIRVYGVELFDDPNIKATRTALNGSDEPGDHFLSDFSSKLSCPLRFVETRTANGAMFEALLEYPEVGKIGTNTFMFGERFQHYQFGEGMRAWNMVVTRPTEVLINDMLVAPGSLKGLRQSAEVFWGYKTLDGCLTEVQKVAGKYAVERLGTGPDALATPDVPRYSEMARAAVKNVGWDIDQYEAYRIRVEYPIYQTNVRMRWDPVKQD